LPWALPSGRIHTLSSLRTGIGSEVSGCAPVVPVIKTDLWDSYDPCQALAAAHPAIPASPYPMRGCASGFLIIRHERLHMPVQGRFAENDHVVQTLTPGIVPITRST